MIACAQIPEVRLVLACARAHLAPGDRAALEAALDAGVDWARVLHLARWHGMRPLLHRHLGAMDSGRVPRPVLVELWAEAETIAGRNRALHAELGRICSTLEGGGIRSLPYKGPTLALAAYGDLALREFGDLDILVARSDVLAARDTLCAAGYVEEYPLRPHVQRAFIASDAQYHLVLRSPVLGHLVELHWKTDPDSPVERLEDPAWWHATLRPGALRGFTDEELLLVLCVHGSKHGWSSLGWLVDVAELLALESRIDWERFCDRARAIGCSRRVGVGLWLAAELLGAPLAPAARAMAERSDVRRLAATLMPAILAAEPDSPGVLRGLRLGLAMVERPEKRIGVVFRTVCLPSLVEWTRWPLPRPLFFMYPVLRMGRLAGKYSRRGIDSLFAGRRLHS